MKSKLKHIHIVRNTEFRPISDKPQSLKDYRLNLLIKEIILFKRKWGKSGNPYIINLMNEIKCRLDNNIK